MHNTTILFLLAKLTSHFTTAVRCQAWETACSLPPHVDKRKVAAGEEDRWHEQSDGHRYLASPHSHLPLGFRHHCLPPCFAGAAFDWTGGEVRIWQTDGFPPVTIGQQQGDVSIFSLHCGSWLSNGGLLCIVMFLEKILFFFFLCEFKSRCSSRLINSLFVLGCPTITVWGSFHSQKDHIDTVFAGFWRSLYHCFCCCLKKGEKKVFLFQARPISPNHDRGALHSAEHRHPPWKIIRCECLGMIMRSKHLTKLGRGWRLEKEYGKASRQEAER